MKKLNNFTLIGLALTFLTGLFGIWRINHLDYYTGGFALMFAVVVFLFLFFNLRQKVKIPFDVQKKHYIRMMEEHEKISINPLAEIYVKTDEGERYVFVLRDEVDGISKYYPCEADMYVEASFGRGYGQYFDKKQKAEDWFTARAKLNAREVIAKEISNIQLNELLLKKKQQMAMESVRNQQENEFK